MRRVAYITEPGIHARIVLQLLRADPWWCWTCADAITGAGLSEPAGWPALHQLLSLGLIEKVTHDGWIRIQLTARGRRFPL